MITARRPSGASLAIAAAALFVSACTTGESFYAQTGQVKCQGVNGCKGQSDCKTANNDCKGKNACRAQGMLIMGPFDCWKNQMPQFKPYP